MLEILSQSFLFSGILYYWVNHPEKRWLNWLLGILFVLVLLMSLMGYWRQPDISQFQPERPIHLTALFFRIAKTPPSAGEFLSSWRVRLK